MRLLTGALLVLAALAAPSMAVASPAPRSVQIRAFEESSYSAHSLGSEHFKIVRYARGNNPRFYWARTEFRDIGCTMRLHLHLTRDGWFLWDELFVAGCREYN